VNRLLVVAGPTASGKSALALSLAEEFQGSIINADSMQVYQGVPVLTAQPSAADRKRAPHLLYGVIPPERSCSAGRWRQMASEACAKVWAEGGLPLLVGGTGLYIRSLLQGLSPIPAIPDDVREASRALFAELGNERFHHLLAERDAEMAARLDPGNSQRLVRAWEVLQATGRSLAKWQAEPRQGGLDATSRIITVIPPRPRLYAACDGRLAAMLQHGALEEVQALLALRLDPALPVMKALGVAELAAHLRGDCGLADALAAAQRATRNYAKRQMTWFRHQLVADFVINTQLSESEIERIFSFIRSCS
jgi:tRNA dimethylallyltransferase